MAQQPASYASPDWTRTGSKRAANLDYSTGEAWLAGYSGVTPWVIGLKRASGPRRLR